MTYGRSNLTTVPLIFSIAEYNTVLETLENSTKENMVIARRIRLQKHHMEQSNAPHFFDRFKISVIMWHLMANGGNVFLTSRILKMNRNTIYNLFNKQGILDLLNSTRAFPTRGNVNNTPKGSKRKPHNKNSKQKA